MSELPTLLFLHGVGSGDPDDEWQDSLESALTKLGYPDLSGVKVVAPKYRHGLFGVDDDFPLPKVKVQTLRGDEAARHRREYQRRRTAMEKMLGWDEQGNGLLGVDRLLPLAAELPWFVQARHYVEQGRIRAWVLRRVLEHVGEPTKLVIVGHSLGSVIAADVLRRLPPTIEVVGMVTIGSPLAHETFHLDRLTEVLDEPPANLRWWVNFWSTADVVPARRGLSSAIPWVLDQRILERNPIGAHDATNYLEDKRVATAIGHALFGSRSTALDVAYDAVDAPLDYSETIALLALRFAHLTMSKLEGERQERYRDALRQVQSATFEQIKVRNHSDGRLLSKMIAELAVDLSDPQSVPAEPRPVDHPSMDHAVVQLVVVATTNVLRPFEIEVPKPMQREAMAQLTMDVGLGTKLGSNVFAAVEEARDVLKGPINWLKWTALGLGAAAVLAATGGLALVAAPGAAGAAAVTSALAAFGPGGMIGGLLTAGTLVTAGGGSIAVGLAAPATAAATVEAVVAAQLAAAILRRKEGLKQDPQTWSGLTELEIELAKELSRLKAVSDESAPSLKELARKVDAIRRALDYLQRNGLSPQLLQLTTAEG